MKKDYLEFTLEILFFDEDVITTSPGDKAEDDIFG